MLTSSPLVRLFFTGLEGKISVLIGFSKKKLLHLSVFAVSVSNKSLRAFLKKILYYSPTSGS